MRSFYKDWSGTSSNRAGPPKLVGSSHRHHQDWPARSRLQDLTGRTIRNPDHTWGFPRAAGETRGLRVNEAKVFSLGLGPLSEWGSRALLGSQSLRVAFFAIALIFSCSKSTANISYFCGYTHQIQANQTPLASLTHIPWYEYSSTSLSMSGGSEALTDDSTTE